jgi:hypothetical protein
VIELLFQLEQDEDGWPPVAVEGLWCEPHDGSYRVETCPLFVKGLSVGDLIDVEQDERGEVLSFDVVRPSRNSTVWIIFWDESKVEPTLAELGFLDCDTTGPLGGWKPKLCSANVPGNVSLNDVDAALEPQELGQIAVAYPSNRHGAA